MELSLCKPDLTSRQMLFGLRSETEDIKASLVECCICDTALFGNDHFLNAISALKTASREIASLRAVSSPCTLGELSSQITDFKSFIYSI